MNSPERLARTIEEFLAEASNAIVLEDGVLAFDFATARYALSTEHGKCLLHIWSPERNAVRRVLDAEVKSNSLRLSVLRFGQSKPQRLEICRDRDQRSPSQRRAARSAYQGRLRALLERRFAGWTIERLTTEMDLARSFSSVYTRGLLKQGTRAFAVLGVNADESQAAIDGAVTFGILWLDYCRERQTRCHVEGLKLIVPRGTAATVRERLAHLNREAARWQLFCFDEREAVFEEIDTADRGNIKTRLVQCPNEPAVRERFADSIRRVLDVAPHADVVVLSAGEIAFRLHGLEIARARLEPQAGSFHLCEQITYGTGANETLLTDDTSAQFAELLRQASAIRRVHGDHTHPLWRMVPERWLESRVVRDIRAIDDRLDPECVYSQVPAFAASDRAMIDVLGITTGGRLAILELKADEDIHLPMQGIDYWARVEWHRLRGEFERFGYFPGRQLASQPPMLLLVAPALRVHPAIGTLLRYIAPEIDIALVGIDERWREQLRVVFRKRAAEPVCKIASSGR